MKTYLTDEQWMQYTRDGYLRLGKLLGDDDLAALQQRIDQIMMGEADIDYDKIMMQLDSTSGEYDDIGAQTKGHKGATLNYRKIEQLELDSLFLRFMQRPIFKEICDRVYGRHVPVGTFRTMFMNKPAGRGTKLPWHQDHWNDLDRDPLITVWTALDPATTTNGCVQVIPGTHRFGVINPDHASGFLTPQLADEHCPEEQAVDIELEAGEVCLLHNWLLHSSDRNNSDQSRRAVSVCYMDARSVGQDGRTWPVIFGEGALNPDKLCATCNGCGCDQ